MKNEIVFKLTSLEKERENLLPLFEAHNKELNQWPELNLGPRFDAYIEAEKRNAFKCFTASEANHLIGYLLFDIDFHGHYENCLYATQQAWFILPEKRGFGYNFFKWCLSQLKLMGVKLVSFSVTPEFDYSPMLIRNGFKRTETVYQGRL